MSSESSDTPTHLGVYRIESILGQGGMGQVFLAFDERLERRVAVKRIRRDKIDERALTRFRREARAVARLSHPAIVQVYDVFDGEDGECIVMEHVEGDNLADLIAATLAESPGGEGGGLLVVSAVKLAMEIAEGLADAHSKGLVHRDLKAANVIVTPAGHAKILDFGLARRLGSSDQMSTADEEPDPGLTRTGALMGTAHAMSPEQAYGQDVDHRSDLFALGSLLYEMLTAHKPFQGRNIIDTLFRITNEEPTSLAQLRPEAPEELVALVGRLLAKNPADRPPNAGVVAAELEQIAALETGTVRLAREWTENDGHGVPPNELSKTVTLAEPIGRDASGLFTAAGLSADGSETANVIRALLLTGPVAVSDQFDSGVMSRTLDLSVRHDRVARDLLARFDGVEIEKADGFLLLFERPAEALAFALAYHRGLAELSEADEHPQVAVAIHFDEIHLRPNPPQDVARGAKPLEVEGLAKQTLARLRDLARGGQTLLTRGAFDLARQAASDDDLGSHELRWLAHGSYLFDDLPDPLEICEVGEVGSAPLKAPADTGRARRAVAPGDEITLGWRPAPGQPVPRRPHWILRERAGQGGFGEVWLAVHAKTHDQRVFKFCFEAERLRALEREVTLFRLLRESLGHREDIARILDWNFEEPPYTLEAEYTAGGNLADWAGEQGGIAEVPLDTRLELLAQVAEALAAAHSVGVLHKDVKPDNVLITMGAGGRPQAVLTDFGIGMITDEDLLVAAGITQLGVSGKTLVSTDGSEGGTPLYMAPELLAGMSPTVQADIYGLGVMLYQLVVGDLDRPLAPGWRREVDDEILRRDIAAFADGSPRERPQSALEVAERLRRVEQRRTERQAAIEAQEKAEKSRRRRKLLTTVAAVSSVFLVVVTVLAIQAVRARGEAQRGRAQAEELIDFMLFDLRDSLDAIGRLDLLSDVAHSSREYFDSLANDGEAGAVIYKRGLSFLNIGDVLYDQGETEAAMATYGAARDLFHDALEERSDDEWWQGLSQSQAKLGRALRESGEMTAALTEYRAAVDIARRLLVEQPEDRERRFHLADRLYRLALWQERNLESELALATGREAIALVEGLTVGRDEAHWRQWLLLVDLRTLIGESHVTLKQWDQAVEAFRATHELVVELAENDSANTTWRRRLGNTYYNNGIALRRTKNFDAAIESLEAAADVFEHEAIEDPTRVEWQSLQAASRLEIARNHRQLGDLAAAEEAYRVALPIYEEIAARDPARVNWQKRLAFCHQSIGWIRRQQSDFTAALQSHRSAHTIRERVAAIDPSELQGQNEVAFSHVVLGRIYRQLGDEEQAIRELEQALEVIGPVTERSDTRTFIDTEVQALLELGRVEEARPMVEELAKAGWQDPDFLVLARAAGLI